MRSPQRRSYTVCSYASPPARPRLFPQPHLHATLFVDVLTIVLTHELDHLVVGQTTVAERVGQWLLEHHRIVDRDLVVKHVRRHQPDALDDPHLAAVRHAVVSGYRLLDADGVDDERVAFPAPHRVAVVTGRHLVDRQLRLIEIDAPYFAERLGHDGDLPRRRQDLDRIRRDRHHPRHSVGIAQHRGTGWWLTAAGGLGLGGPARIVSLGVLRLEDDWTGGRRRDLRIDPAASAHRHPGAADTGRAGRLRARDETGTL